MRRVAIMRMLYTKFLQFSRLAISMPKVSELYSTVHYVQKGGTFDTVAIITGGVPLLTATQNVSASFC